jgi:hypothetical protein
MWLLASMQIRRSGSLRERFGSQRWVTARGMMT